MVVVLLVVLVVLSKVVVLIIVVIVVVVNVVPLHRMLWTKVRALHGRKSGILSRTKLISL